MTDLFALVSQISTPIQVAWLLWLAWLIGQVGTYRWSRQVVPIDSQPAHVEPQQPAARRRRRRRARAQDEGTREIEAAA